MGKLKKRLLGALDTLNGLGVPTWHMEKLIERIDDVAVSRVGEAVLEQLRKEAAAWSATLDGAPAPGVGTWEKCGAGSRPRDDFAERLTDEFAEAAREAVASMHAKGVSAHGEVDGAWREVPPKANKRPSWDHIWMEMAHTLAQRSVAPRMKVGALIVPDDNTRVLALGYNGDWKGGPNRVESDEPGKSGFIHAELNALIKLDFSEQRKKVMYVTVSPCASCASAIINAGISEVVYDELYRLPDGVERLRLAGVRVKTLARDA